MTRTAPSTDDGGVTPPIPARAVLPPPPPRETYTREARDTLADSAFRHVVSAHELKVSLQDGTFFLRRLIY